MRWRGPLTLVVLCLVPVGLWVVASPIEGRFGTASAALTSIAVCLALAGTSGFAFNLVLGARLRLVDEYFGGLDKVFRVHQVNGRIVFLALLGHALGIIVARAADPLGSVVDLFALSAGWTIWLGIIALAVMTAAVALTLYVRLNHEVFVYVQRTFGFAFILAALHVFRTPGTKALSPALTYYLVAVSLLGLIAFAYRSLFDSVLVKRHDYRVSNVDPLDEAVMEITMTPEDKPLRFKPGQFLFVTFYSDALTRELHPFSVDMEGQSAIVTLRPGEVHEQFHPFSITSTPGDGDLKVVFKEVGDYTHAMRSLEKGTWARVEGPYGTFSYLEVRGKRQVWIAGGIGVTPFLSMARSLDDSHYDVHFYYAMKSIRNAYLLAEFLQLQARLPNFHVIPFPEDEVGYLTVDAIAERTPDLLEREVMLCGPPPMIDALRTQLYERGVPRNHVHFEKFGFTPKQRAKRA